MEKFVVICVLLVANCLPFDALAQPNQITYSNNVFRVDNLEIPRKAAGAKNDPYYGDFFWEFGDGNYSSERLPNYQYGTNITFDLRLSMTPFYSTDLPKSIFHKNHGRSTQ